MSNENDSNQNHQDNNATRREPSAAYTLPPGMELCTHEEDEISIADLLTILWQRKLLIFGLSFLITVATAIWALQQPNIYRIQTVIEIGRNGGGGRVESAEDLVQKLTNAYRLQVVSEAVKDERFSKDLLANWSPKVNAPRDSDLVVVSIDSTQQFFDQNTELLNLLIDLARKDHDRVLVEIRNSIGNDIKNEQNKLAELGDRRLLIAAKQDNLTADLKLAQAEATALQARLAQAEQDRKHAINEISGQAQALTMLMIENAVQVDRQQLMRTLRRIDVQIPSEQNALVKQLADLKREEEEVQRRIQTLNTRLQNFISTRPVVEPTPSLKKVAPSRSLYCLAAAALSFFGLYGIFLLQFIMRKQAENKAAKENAS